MRRKLESIAAWVSLIVTFIQLAEHFKRYAEQSAHKRKKRKQPSFGFIPEKK